MRFITIFMMLALLSACGGGKFIVKQSDDRFSEDKNPIYMSENNRISSKSIAGGFHIDDKGVYINPFVQKEKGTNKILLLGFNIVNKTDYTTMHGGVNQLGIIKNVTFRLDDGTIISKDVTNQDNRSSDTISYNSVARYASYEKWESGIIPISKSEFLKLANAKSLSCKIIGSRQSVVYEEKDIADNFISNLKQFSQQYLQ